MAVRASDRSYRALRDEIVELALPPGTVLAEVEQAARLGVSRTPVREALGRLVADGLVTQQGGRGLVVAELGFERIAELYEVREALEVQAARLAAERREPAEFARLERELLDAARLIDDDDPARASYYALVDLLDAAIDAAVRNDYLVTSLRALRTHLARIRRVAAGRPERLARAAEEHLQILRAILDGDAALAEAATRVHLRNALRDLREQTAAAAPESPVDPATRMAG